MSADDEAALPGTVEAAGADAPDAHETDAQQTDGQQTIVLPECCLVVLVGASGAGKSSFARQHFKPTEILASDDFRAMVADDAGANDASADAFRLLHEAAEMRLRRRLMTVIDATNLRPDNRRALVSLADDAYSHAVAIVFDVPQAVCVARNRERPGRVPRGVIHRHVEMARGALKTCRREGFVHVYQVDADARSLVRVTRERLRTDARQETGPFDIIGDVHGCIDELLTLVGRLGYIIDVRQESEPRRYRVQHPEGRRLIGLGDYADRGPASPDVLAFFMDAAACGTALCLRGNHDHKLLRHLSGRHVSSSHGFDATLAQFAKVSEKFAAEVKAFLERLPSHLLLDGGRLAVAHAGIEAAMQGRAGKRVREFATFGGTTGEVDEFGLAVRSDWAADYRGAAAVVYGHVAAADPVWINNALCIDTGCVFGGALTALRWPERTLVAVPAGRTYYAPQRPLSRRLPPVHRLPDAASLTVTQTITTRYGPPVRIGAARAAAGFETLVRFAADPRWLITVAPTTATVEASAQANWLERPEDAFAHYLQAGVETVCVQEKHMGSRALVIVCRDDGTRFGDPDRRGAVISKGGRDFFADAAATTRIVDAVRTAVTGAGLWDELGTDWIVLDGEMLPWSVKAAGLIRDTFAATATAGHASASALMEVYAQGHRRGLAGCEALLFRAIAERDAMVEFRAAYRPFAVPYRGIDDLRYRPFHVLAAEGRVFATESHAWHMQIAERLAAAAERHVSATAWRMVSPGDPVAVADAVRWWEAITTAGAEGFVVKGPHLALLDRGVAPSIKVRGRKYLRIIYGAEYDRPDLLARLKQRATARKRSVARIGATLQLESLARFVEGAALANVHEVVAAALALASEPIDTRL